MIPAVYYDYVYTFIFFALSLIVAKNYVYYDASRINVISKQDLTPTICLALFMIIFIGFRPFSIYFCDMEGYGNAMETHIFEHVEYGWTNNYLFTPLMAFLSKNGFPPRAPILILATINIVCSTIAARKFFPNDTLLALVIIFVSFTEYGKLTNGIKAGCASSLLLCAIAYRDKIWISLLFLFLSFGFHHSMQLALAAYAICLFYKKSEKHYFYAWVICLILAIAHVTYFQELFGGMTDESGASYLLQSIEDSGFGGRTGFRFDFVLFSFAPVLVGYYAIFKKNIQSETYNFILNMYIVTNAVWMLCMYAPYTNRIAEISWGIYPIVLIYPFLKENWGTEQYITLRKVVYANAWFTFLMTFVYYTLIHVVKM